MENFGLLRLSTRVVIRADEHGREQEVRRVTLLSLHCHYKDIDDHVLHFLRLNPNVRNSYVEQEFVVRLGKVISKGWED